MSKSADGVYSVVIVGAGPTGLSLAIELGSRGVSCLLVERNDRVGYAPRAKTTNVRTRAHLRRWGIADRLAEASPFGVDYPSDIIFVTRLAGAFLARIENASNCSPERNSFYPEHGQWVPQYKLEQVLRERVESCEAVDVRFNTEFVSAAQGGGSVNARLREHVINRETVVTCEYLVGADGARSTVRDLIDATMTGQYGLSRNYNIVFRAPGLAQAHRHGPATMFWQINPTAPSVIGPMDSNDVWFFAPLRLPPGIHLSNEEATELIRESTGINVPYEILSCDEWIASCLIADHYRDKRIFLAGDACHLHPPFGGYGMNMGVSDGVDLGWKLAAVLQGWGGRLLIESYEAERRPVHQEMIAEAQANHAVLPNDFSEQGLEEQSSAGEALRRRIGEQIVATKEREFHTLGTVLGIRYRASPIILSEADIPVTPSDRNYHPSSQPGCLAPHLWLVEDRSLYDLFGSGFALICYSDVSADELVPAQSEAERLGVAMRLVRIAASQASGTYPARLTLVRPDQHVAWRGAVWRSGALEYATGRSSRAAGDRSTSLET
jgi:2-polyprenyl-6-methoxyphenol hydroxylase-like FAD-dependent oxidoreductase